MTAATNFPSATATDESHTSLRQPGDSAVRANRVWTAEDWGTFRACTGAANGAIAVTAGASAAAARATAGGVTSPRITRVGAAGDQTSCQSENGERQDMTEWPHAVPHHTSDLGGLQGGVHPACSRARRLSAWAASDPGSTATPKAGPQRGVARDHQPNSRNEKRAVRYDNLGLGGTNVARGAKKEPRAGVDLLSELLGARAVSNHRCCIWAES